jgi:8-oxo-dGTP pyrophosphatase MutT (NUDIX family)
MTKNRLFQYCPKLIVFSEDRKSVLLARRQGEADYDGTFSFIGGKSETTDESLIAALKREKDEEIGIAAKVRVCWTMSCYQVLFHKKDGNTMIVPHHVALYAGGDIELNPEEYAERVWAPIDTLDQRKDIIENIPDAIAAAQKLMPILDNKDFAEI